MAKSKVRPSEVAFAYQLLRYLHANVNNIYLLLAVIAWVRRESGSNYIGNNPLNLRPGADDAPYRIGIRKGNFSVYASLTAGAQATARRLLRAGNDWRGYGLVVAAAQRGTGPTEQDKQQQALDFLNALALSKWSATHYGLGTKPDPNSFDQSKNMLIKVWASLLGAPVTIPADVIKPPEPKVPIPKQPRSFVNRVIERDYLLPYAALQFYQRRSRVPEGLPGEPSQAAR